MHVYAWLMHSAVEQKLTHCKATIKKKGGGKKTVRTEYSNETKRWLIAFSINTYVCVHVCTYRNTNISSIYLWGSWINEGECIHTSSHHGI